MTPTENKTQQIDDQESTTSRDIQLNLEMNPASVQKTKRELRGIELPFKTKVLKRRNQWDKLFDEFLSMKAISFVTQPEFLLDYFEQRNYRRIELLVGKGLVDNYKTDMADTKWQTVEDLHQRTSKGELVLWGTKDLIHTKLYILTNDTFTRVIVGSPNLSYKASGSGQVELVVYWDLYHGNSTHMAVLEKFNEEYDSHFNDKCTKFLDDLSELFIELDDMDPKEVIRIWKSNSQHSDVRARRAIYTELSALAFQETGDQDDDVITIDVPKISKSRKKVLTDSFGARFQGSEMTVSRSRYLKAESHQGLPLMRLDEETGELRVGIHGRPVNLNVNCTPEELDQGLADIEQYIGMVDSATCDAPEYVKMSMMECIIYSFAAPFANHWLRSKRKLTNYSNRRGPRHLLLFGDGFNGKTTFLSYINWLITGSHFEPVDAKKYQMDEWVNLFEHIQTSESLMPVSIDDVKKRAVQGASPTLEQFIKPYFENEWHDALNFAKLLFSSNYSVTGDWAKSRIRRLNFDVQFSGDETDEILINDLLSKANPVFGEFSSDYISRLAVGTVYKKDELSDAREIMEELYAKAGRKLPSYFPLTPPEEKYDVDAIFWYNQLRRHKLITESRKNGVIHLEFLTPNALHDCKGRLPQTIKTQFSGSSLVIQNPAVFDKFLEKGKTRKNKPLVSGLLSWMRRE